MKLVLATVLVAACGTPPKPTPVTKPPPSVGKPTVTAPKWQDMQGVVTHTALTPPIKLAPDVTGAPPPKTAPELTSSAAIADGVLATRSIARDREAIELRMRVSDRWQTLTLGVPAHYDVRNGVRHEECATVDDKLSGPAPVNCSPIAPPAVAVDTNGSIIVAWVSGAGMLSIAIARDGKLAMHRRLQFAGVYEPSPWGATPIAIAANDWIVAYGDRVIDAKGAIEALHPDFGRFVHATIVPDGFALVAQSERLETSVHRYDRSTRTVSAIALRAPATAIEGAGSQLLAITNDKLVTLDGAGWEPLGVNRLTDFAGASWIHGLRISASTSAMAVGWLGGMSQTRPVIRTTVDDGWAIAGTTFDGVDDMRRDTSPLLAIAHDPDGALFAVTADATKITVSRWFNNAWSPVGKPLVASGVFAAAIAFDETRPIVAWIESARVRVARVVDTKWIISDVPAPTKCAHIAIDAKSVALSCEQGVIAFRDNKPLTTALPTWATSLAIRGDRVAAITHTAKAELGVALWENGAWHEHALDATIAAVDLDDDRAGIAWLNKGNPGFATFDVASFESEAFPTGTSTSNYEAAITMTPKPCVVFAWSEQLGASRLEARCSGH
jgi:hypothetical protein